MKTKQQKREEALARLQAYESLTLEQRVQKLDASGHNALRQRLRYAKKMRVAADAKLNEAAATVVKAAEPVVATTPKPETAKDARRRKHKNDKMSPAMSKAISNDPKS